MNKRENVHNRKRKNTQKIDMGELFHDKKGKLKMHKNMERLEILKSEFIFSFV